MNTFSKTLLIISALCALGVAALLVLGLGILSGPLAVLLFVTLAIGCQGHQVLKGYSFTIWIMSAVVSSMFYPQFFVRIGEYETKNLIVPLMQLIMFGMGATSSWRDFLNVIKMPQAVIAGTLAQYVIMPLIGLALATILKNYFNTPPEIAAGVILVGCSPCGLSSNVMNFIAGNNIALSIALTTVATLIAPVVTPLLMKILAGTMVTIEFLPMMIDIIKMIIIPIAAGQLFVLFFKGKAAWLDKLLPKVSMAGIAIIITVITAAGQQSLLKVGGLLIVCALLHNGLGYFFGYWMSRLVFRTDRWSARTIAIEVGLQNGGLASGLALGMGKLNTMGLFSAIFGPVMNTTGSTLANYWHTRQLPESEKKEIS